MTGLRLGARLWWGAVPLLLLLWSLGALSGIAGLPTTPLTTLALHPLAVYARDIAMALTVGGLLVGIRHPGDRVRGWTLGWGMAGLALIALGAVTLHADLMAHGVVDSLGPQAVASVIADTIAGKALVVQAICLIVALVLILIATRVSSGLASIARWTALVLGLVAAATPAMASHAGILGPHAVAGVSVGVHVAAVSAWVGGLAAVTALVVRDPDGARLLRRFSPVALACVIVAAETGLLTASLTSPSLSDLVGSAYGSVVVVKAVLLGWLIWLGWLVRRRVLDHLDDKADTRVDAEDSSAPRPRAALLATLARLTGVELVLMGTAFAASVLLARLGPPHAIPEGIAPLTLIALGVAAPMLAAVIRPVRSRFLDAYPEVCVVIWLVVLADVGALGPLDRLLGGFGLVIELLLLIGAGWLAVQALSGPGARIAGWCAAAGLPLVFAIIVWLNDTVSWPLAVVSAAAGMALVIGWRRAAVRRATPVAERELSGVSR